MSSISSVHKHTVKPGDGANTPKEGDKITIHYSVALANQGTKHLESTREGLNPRPLKFVVGDGKVVPGVEKAVQKMTLGEKALVTVPPEEGYGSQGKGDLIPPNAELVYEVELLEINDVPANE